MVFIAAGYAIVVGILSLVCIVVYRADKQRAGTGARRVPERTLHLLGFLGGWPGAWYARQRFRHKTQKLSFRVTFWAVVLMHIAVVGTIAYALLAVTRTTPGSP